MPILPEQVAVNVGLERQHREAHQLFADGAAPWTVHAITSPRYARVHHDELAARVLDLMADHPAWHLPLGYKDGVYGAELVPSARESSRAEADRQPIVAYPGARRGEKR